MLGEREEKRSEASLFTINRGTAHSSVQLATCLLLSQILPIAAPRVSCSPTPSSSQRATNGTPSSYSCLWHLRYIALRWTLLLASGIFIYFFHLQHQFYLGKVLSSQNVVRIVLLLTGDDEIFLFQSLFPLFNPVSGPLCGPAITRHVTLSGGGGEKRVSIVIVLLFGFGGMSGNRRKDPVDAGDGCDSGLLLLVASPDRGGAVGIATG